MSVPHGLLKIRSETLLRYIASLHALVALESSPDTFEVVALVRRQARQPSSEDAHLQAGRVETRLVSALTGNQDLPVSSLRDPCSRSPLTRVIKAANVEENGWEEPLLLPFLDGRIWDERSSGPRPTLDLHRANSYVSGCLVLGFCSEMLLGALSDW